MNYKCFVLHIIFITLCIPIVVYAQENTLARVSFMLNEYNNVKLTSSPNNHIILYSPTEAYYTDNIHNENYLSVNITNPKFINNIKDICWVGYDKIIIRTDENLRLYHIEINGMKVVLRELESFDFCSVDKLITDGFYHIWCATSDSKIHHSSDGGQAWSETVVHDSVSIKKLRVNDMFFGQGKGLISYSSNILFYTDDYGASFKKIKTPLDQNCFKSFTRSTQYIPKVRILNGLFIIEQGDKCFLTDSINVEWKQLQDVVWFEITEDGHLIEILSDGQILFLDEKLNVFKPFSIPKDVPIKGYAIKDNALYVITTSFMYEFKDDEKLMNLYESGTDIDEIIGNKKNGKYEVDGQTVFVDNNDVYVKDKKTKKWSRFMPLGKYCQASFCEKNTIFFYTPAHNLNQIDLENKSVKEYDWASFEMPSVSIKKIEAFNNSWDCSRGYMDSNMIEYTIKKGILVKRNNRVSKHQDNEYFLNDLPKTINLDDIKSLLNLIDINNPMDELFSDTIVTQKDKDIFMELMRPSGKYVVYTPDFLSFHSSDIAENLYSYIHPLSSIDKQELVDIMKKQPFSTSTGEDFIGINIYFQDGSIVQCVSSSKKRGYMCCPWMIRQGNFYYYKYSLQIGYLINKIFEQQLIPEFFTSKAYALYQIARNRAKKE